MTGGAVQRLRAWSSLAAAFALVLLSSERAFEISAFLRSRGVLGATVMISVGAATVLALYLLVFGCGLRSLGPYLRAAPFVLATVACLAFFRRDPPERFHFVEYGILFVLALNAVTIDLGRPLAYVAAWIITAALGLIDECAQSLTVVRYFDWNDVWMNLAAASSAATISAALFARDPARVRRALQPPR